MKVQKQIDELLTLRASEWIEILPTASERQLRELAVWLGESRRHVEEFLEVAEVELSLSQLDAKRRHDVEALLQKVAAPVSSLPARGASDPSSIHARTQSSIRRWKRAAVVALAASLLATVGLFYFDVNSSERYATSMGEQRIVELTDASTVTLNASSSIEVDLESSAREIVLKHGEALFNVAHDPARPFRVRTRAGTVQALGTQFNVYDRADGDTRVSVLDGRVRAMSDRGAELLLGAGEQADIRHDGTIRRLDKASAVNAVAWRQHRLVFDGAPLEEIVAEFNRYNPSLRLKLHGLEGDARRYDGAFAATDPGSLANLLAREPDLVVERTRNEIVIRRRGR